MVDKKLVEILADSVSVCYFPRFSKNGSPLVDFLTPIALFRMCFKFRPILNLDRVFCYVWQAPPLLSCLSITALLSFAISMFGLISMTLWCAPMDTKGHVYYGVAAPDRQRLYLWFVCFNVNDTPKAKRNFSQPQSILD